jgi:hypothetical protein
LGYDGQFYAQLALHPDLKDPNLANALDNPVYRARRIGLSLLAFCLGWENRFGFFKYTHCSISSLACLAFGNLTFCGIKEAKRLATRFCTSLVNWNVSFRCQVATGSTSNCAGSFSIVFHNNWIMAAALLGISGLFKETSVLSFYRNTWSNGSIKSNIKRLVISVMILILTIALWLLYVHMRMPSGSAMGTTQF